MRSVARRPPAAASAAHGLEVRRRATLLAERLPAVPRGERGDGADGLDCGGDLGVGRRHDLGAVAEVDLVAVVLRRVVARGHHHARDAAEVADRVGEDRGRKRARQHVRRAGRRPP